MLFAATAAASLTPFFPSSLNFSIPLFFLLLLLLLLLQVPHGRAESKGLEPLGSNPPCPHPERKGVKGIVPGGRGWGEGKE